MTVATASAISRLLASEECDKDAIDILKKRFGDERLIIHNHLRSLVDLKPVSSSPNVHQLRQLYYAVHLHVRCLKAFATSPVNDCLMLREILFRVLPFEIILSF